MLHNQPMPEECVQLSLAIFLASIGGLFANINMKVSMHAIAMGVMVTFVALLAFHESVSMSFYLSNALLIAGLVCTSRLIVSDHRPGEIYIGFIAGVLSQLAAQYFVGSY